MRNPIEAILREKNLSTNQAAIEFKISYYQLWCVLRGYVRQLPKGLKIGLAQCGYDPAELNDAYIVWRNSVSNIDTARE